MKKLMKLGIISLVAVITLTGCGCTKEEKKETKEDKVTYNTNKGVVEDKKQDGLTFTNTSLEVSDKGSTLTTEVTNTTDKDISLRIFNILVKDKEGKLLVSLEGYVGDNILAGKSRTITTATDMNLKDAYDIEYELVK